MQTNINKLHKVNTKHFLKKKAFERYFIFSNVSINAAKLV